MGVPRRQRNIHPCRVPSNQDLNVIEERLCKSSRGVQKQERQMATGKCFDAGKEYKSKELCGTALGMLASKSPNPATFNRPNSLGNSSRGSFQCWDLGDIRAARAPEASWRCGAEDPRKLQPHSAVTPYRPMAQQGWRLECRGPGAGCCARRNRAGPYPEKCTDFKGKRKGPAVSCQQSCGWSLGSCLCCSLGEWPESAQAQKCG